MPSWSCSPHLGLSLGLWLAELATLDQVSSNPFPKLGVGNESQTGELVVGSIWHLELTRLRLHKGSDGLCTCVHCLHIVCLHFLPALSFVLPGKMHALQELGVNILRRFYLCDQGFWTTFLYHLGLVMCGMVLGSGHSCAAVYSS